MDFEKFIHVESEWRRKKTLESDNRLQMHVGIPFRSGDAFSIRVLKVIWYFSFYREKCIFALSHLCARTKSMAKMAFSLPANTMRRQWIMFSQVLFLRLCIENAYQKCITDAEACDSSCTNSVVFYSVVLYDINDSVPFSSCIHAHLSTGCLSSFRFPSGACHFLHGYITFPL